MPINGWTTQKTVLNSWKPLIIITVYLHTYMQYYCSNTTLGPGIYNLGGGGGDHPSYEQHGGGGGHQNEGLQCHLQYKCSYLRGMSQSNDR